MRVVSLLDDSNERKYRIPTYYLSEAVSETLRDDEEIDTQWVLQPRAQQPGNDRALDEIIEKIGKNYIYVADLHRNNCGFYRGKAVMFDW